MKLASGVLVLVILAGSFVAWALFRTPGHPPAPSPLPSSDSSPTAIPIRFGDGFVDDGGYPLAFSFTPEVADRRSLTELRESIRARVPRGRQAIAEQAREPGADRTTLAISAALLSLYDGDFLDAEARLTAVADDSTLSPELRANALALRGLAAMRRGEVANCVACVGPSSCIFPIAREAVHPFPDGVRQAVHDFIAYLRVRPDDVGVKWLLGIAAMALGDFPDAIPPEFRLPTELYQGPTSTEGRFRNIAQRVGLGARGPNMLGGSVFDDFTGDRLPDLFIGSIDAELEPSLFVNRGDGTFEDRSLSLGLGGQGTSANARHADFDNDGRLDLLILRGAWEHPARMSLMRNTDAGFEDVTAAAGLDQPIASESAEWADYDNDGRLDLFVCGETRLDRFDDANRCRLYHNEGNGRFVDVAATAGVENRRWAKGSAWGDYDNDGRPDLYVSNMNGANRLYHNNGDGTFTDVADHQGVTGSLSSFSCWFFDYDNDGWLDLFVGPFRATLNDYVQDRLGQPSSGERLRLFRNRGAEGFEDVTSAVGLDRVIMSMGSNFADIDNDGYLDVALGTGTTTYSSLVPNVLLRNRDGRSFEDVTVAAGAGHLQKGHGTSFADWDGDGDLDLFIETGGSAPGDRAHNVLFENPGSPRHWLALRLEGTRSNRSAIGARVEVETTERDGTTRRVHRVVGGQSSFGGNSLTVHVGLNHAEQADRVRITWPRDGAVQTFTDVAADQFVEIVEGDAEIQRRDRPRFTPPESAPAE